MSTAARFDILIDIKARLDELVKSQDALRQTTAAAQSLGASLKQGLGIDLARRGVEMFKTALIGSVREAFAMAGVIKDQAENLQMTTEAYQVLGQVIKDAGGDMQLLSLMIAQNNRSLAEARSLAGPAANAYRTLGLDPAQMEGMAPERRMEAIGRAIARSKDETAAYGAVSQVVGSRNLPLLIGALKSLASEGYDKAAAAAKNLGQVMDNETVTALDRAQKQIEKLKRGLAVQAGKDVAEMMKVDPSFFSDLQSGLLTMFDWFIRKPGRGIGSLIGNVGNLVMGLPMSSYAAAAAEEARLNALKEKADEAAAAQRRHIAATVAATEAARRNAIADAELAVVKAQINRELDEGNPLFSSEAIRREKTIAGIKAEVAAREKLLALIKASPLENESPQQREARIAKAQAEITSLNARGVSMERGGVSKMQRTNEAFYDMNRPENSYVSAGQGLMGGYRQWAAQLGSTGDQVATALQGNLGSTVGDITTQLTSAITKTQSWGQALNNIWRNFGLSMLQAFVQMVAQWAVSKAAMFAIDMVFAAKSVALSLASAAKSLVAWIPAAIAAAISSYGVAAIIGAAAVVGTIAAFREQGGPVEAGRPYIVGEKRAEVFVPNQSGTIVPSVDAYRVMQRRAGGGGSASAGGLGGEALSGRQRLLVVYTDHTATVEGLKRRPEFETLVVDINRRHLGEIAG